MHKMANFKWFNAGFLKSENGPCMILHVTVHIFGDTIACHGCLMLHGRKHAMGSSIRSQVALLKLFYYCALRTFQMVLYFLGLT